MTPGVFITFEGPDGSGKSTQLRLLAAALESEGRLVVTTRQPGGTPLGSRIRSLLVDSRTDAELGPIDPLAELTLMFADRAQSLAEVIHPALAHGAIVLCDRYTDSSEAYQGSGREVGPDRVRDLHRVICADFQPDLTLLLLPPLEACLHRALRRNGRHLAQTGDDENRFERAGEPFFRRVYARYEAIAQRDAHRVHALREPGSIASIHHQILTLVRSHLP